MDAGVLLLVIALSNQAGQTTAPSAAASTPVRWSVGLEYQRDRFDYHFENPSSFNTGELVPHVFEQRYDADNAWLTGRLRFTLGGRAFETEGGITTTTTGIGIGSDYDTFYQPDGNIIVYGTTADTDAWSWRAAQYISLGSWRDIRWRAGYGYRRDRADFHPSYTTIVQTKPPSAAAFWNTDRETIISEVHEVWLGAERAFAPKAQWHVRVTADVAPTTLARLTTILPDKYAEPIVFMARGLSVNAALHVTRRLGLWYAGLAITYAQAWSYVESDAYRRRAVSATAAVGR